MRTPWLRDLQQRGLVADATKPDELDAHLGTAPRTLYVGFDPTADSLHIGSLLPLLALRRAQLAGHRPIVLVGGGTGLIGIPRASGERALNPAEQVAGWADRLKQQVQPFRFRPVACGDPGTTTRGSSWSWLPSCAISASTSAWEP
jgi:tyrosyl-tRNA synthetase